jgi:hypothetical protein
MTLSAGDLVRGQDGHDPIHPGAAFQYAAVLETVVPDHRDDRTFRSDDHVVLQLHFPNQLDHVVDLFLAAAFLHDHDHEIVSVSNRAGTSPEIVFSC